LMTIKILFKTINCGAAVLAQCPISGQFASS
jgi:hypothetical protein